LSVNRLGLLAQDVLLKDTCSALTLITGKILRLTGPEIFRSRPVDSFIAELSNLVSCVGLIKDAAYQMPSPASARRVTMAIRKILMVLFTHPF